MFRISRSIVASSALLLAVFTGCGGNGIGSGGGGGGGGSISGVYSGQQSSRAVSTTEYDLLQTGTNVTGTARLSLTGSPVVLYTGAVSGTAIGTGATTTVDITVAWSDSTYGTTHLVGTVQSDGSISGTYLRGAEAGTVTLTKTGQTTPNIAGSNWSGYYVKNGDTSQTHNPLSTAFLVQTGDNLTANVTTKDNSGLPKTKPATAVLIGGHLTMIISPDSGGSGSTAIDGTVSGNALTGTFAGNPDTGTFVMNRQ